MEEITKEDLQAQLDELGIEYKKTYGKARLLELLKSDGAPEEVEEEPETVKEVEKELSKAVDSGFSAVMGLNLKRDGVRYEKGQSVDLDDEETYNEFKANGWLA